MPDVVARERAKWSCDQTIASVPSVGWEPVVTRDGLGQIAVVAVPLGQVALVAVVSLQLIQVLVDLDDVVKLARFCVWLSLFFPVSGPSSAEKPSP